MKKFLNGNASRSGGESGGPDLEQSVRVIDLGLIPYAKAEAVQLARLSEVAAGAEETLYLLEHPPVITLGRNGGLEHLRRAPERLAAEGIDLVHTRRGGSVTCHFPGQLVVYPIMRLGGRAGGLRGFFRDMEEATLRTLAAFGLGASRWEGRPGVWLESRKICSIGIGVRRWTSYHGLALNVGSDVSLFSRIALCGLSDASATSMERELGAKVAMEEVKGVFVREFGLAVAHSPMVAGGAAL